MIGIRAIVGELDLEFQPRPLSLAGQFRLAAPEGERSALSLTPLVAGALLVAPALVTLLAGVLRAQFGLPSLFDAISQNPSLSLIVAASLFFGAPVAVILSVLPIIHWKLSRAEGKIATSLVLRPTLAHLVVGGIALLVVAVFFGHLAADEFACWRGVTSAC
jgi:hypothetical protein